MLPMRTIPQLLLDRASAAPGQLVERHKYRGIWREYTYGDVLEKVRAFALGLDAMGIRRGETVAIIGENEPENFWRSCWVFGTVGRTVRGSSTARVVSTMTATRSTSSIIAGPTLRSKGRSTFHGPRRVGRSSFRPGRRPTGRGSRLAMRRSCLPSSTI